MKRIEFEVGKNNRKVVGFLHSDLNEYCQSVEKRPALIVCPGGGYVHLSPREAEPVGFKFFSKGFNVFILYYSIGELIKNYSPVKELAECVERVKNSAIEWQIDKESISVLGFSAGGHLVASLATMWNKEICSPFDCKVKSVILAYPVILDGEFAHKGSIDSICQDGHEREFYSLEKRVDKDTIGCFIFHSADDPTVPVENSLLYMLALKQNHVPFTGHIFPSGGHGWSTATREVGSYILENQCWIDMALKYLDYIE